MFMSLEDAIELVLELASQNVLNEDQVQNDGELKAEREKQLTAIGTVEDFFTNNVFD